MSKGTILILTNPITGAQNSFKIPNINPENIRAGVDKCLTGKSNSLCMGTLEDSEVNRTYVPRKVLEVSIIEIRLLSEQ